MSRKIDMNCPECKEDSLMFNFVDATEVNLECLSNNCGHQMSGTIKGWNE